MTYVIAEIGQNHNGSMETARDLIDMAALEITDPFDDSVLPGVDAVKFTKRDLREELTDSRMAEPYTSEHAFGKTYGEHRAFLELSEEQHAELREYARGRGLDFVDTICAIGALRLLEHFTPDAIKVASRDLTNLPLLEAIADTDVPVILSTGMHGRRELDEALDIITRRHDRITILHCLSQYPADYANINLMTIPWLIENYPGFTIGYSDHSIGIVVPVAAVALGAKVIEKHITLDRQMKGTDHAGSLERDGLWRMMRDIRNLERALGTPGMSASEAASDARLKLERSLAARRDIAAGEVITEDDFMLLSPGDGLRWSERDRLLGRRAKCDIAASELILPDMVVLP